MQRFFLTPDCFAGDRVVFPPGTAHQLYHVLRLRPGATLIVLDNQGSQFQVELDQVTSSATSGRIVSRSPAAGEPRLRLALYISLTQREKFEWILQKCTEAGAASFTPVISSRSLVQGRGEAGKKQVRWEKIVREAAEQSERGRVPEICPVLSFEEACQQANQKGQLALIPWEDERFSSRPLSLRQALTNHFKGMEGSQPPWTALFIGPEGGFSEEEISLARQQGMIPVSLGPRVLRMETAAMIATAIAVETMER